RASTALSSDGFPYTRRCRSWSSCPSPPPRLLRRLLPRSLSRIVADGRAPRRLLLPEWTLLPAPTAPASTSPALVRAVTGRHGSARPVANPDASPCGTITSSPY